MAKGNKTSRLKKKGGPKKTLRRPVGVVVTQKSKAHAKVVADDAQAKEKRKRGKKLVKDQLARVKAELVRHLATKGNVFDEQSITHCIEWAKKEFGQEIRCERQDIVILHDPSKARTKKLPLTRAQERDLYDLIKPKLVLPEGAPFKELSKVHAKQIAATFSKRHPDRVCSQDTVQKVAIHPPPDMIDAVDKTLRETLAVKTKEMVELKKLEAEKIKQDNLALVGVARAILLRGQMYLSKQPAEKESTDESSEAEDGDEDEDESEEELLPTAERSPLVESIVNEAISSMTSLSATNSAPCYEVGLKLHTLVGELQQRYNRFEWSVTLYKAATSQGTEEANFVPALRGSSDRKASKPFGGLDKLKQKRSEIPRTKKGAYDKLKNRSAGISYKLKQLVTTVDTYCVLESEAGKASRERKEQNDVATTAATATETDEVGKEELEAQIKESAAVLEELLRKQHNLNHPDQQLPNSVTHSVGVTLVHVPTYQGERTDSINLSAGPVDQGVSSLLLGLLVASNGQTYGTRQKKKQRTERYGMFAVANEK